MTNEQYVLEEFKEILEQAEEPIMVTDFACYECNRDTLPLEPVEYHDTPTNYLLCDDCYENRLSIVFDTYDWMEERTAVDTTITKQELEELKEKLGKKRFTCRMCKQKRTELQRIVNNAYKNLCDICFYGWPAHKRDLVFSGVETGSWKRSVLEDIEASTVVQTDESNHKEFESQTRYDEATEMVEITREEWKELQDKLTKKEQSKFNARTKQQVKRMLRRKY